MLPRTPKAVIFDMDGLILDSEILYRKSVISAGEQAGLLVGPSVYEGMLGRPWDGIVHLLKDHYGPDFDAEAFRAVWLEHFDRLIALELKLKAGCGGTPRYAGRPCNSTGDLHILSPFSGRTSPGKLRYPGTLQSRHCPGDYAIGKPAPDPYLTAAERLGIAPADCLALEDSHNGIRSAASAGMMAVMVPDLLPPTDEIRALATLVIDDLHQCCGFFA